MFRTAAIAGTVAAVSVLAVPANAADIIVTMQEITHNMEAYVGKRVVITDCLMIGSNNFSGAQCSVNPIDIATLVYIDSDTWTPQAKKLANDCTTPVIEQMCTIKVTGEVSRNTRNQPLILGAVIEIVKQPSQRT